MSLPNSPSRLLFAAILLAAACGRPGASADAAASPVGEEALMEQGVTLLYQKGDAAGAVAIFQEVLQKNPAHYGANFQLARALDRAGKPVEARAWWEKVLPMAEAAQDTATGSAARIRLAQPDTVSQAAMMSAGLALLYTRNDPAAAVEQFRELVLRNSQHYGATFQLAKALDKAGKPAEARLWWKKVLPLAQALEDTAVAAATRARLAQPDTVGQETLMSAGLSLLYTRNDPAAAAEQFHKVIQRNPTHYGAHFQLAKALDGAGKPAEARTIWIKVLGMAEALKDQPTADAARVRLQRNP